MNKETIDGIIKFNKRAEEEIKRLREINEEHRKLNGELREDNKEQEEYIKYWQNEYDKKCEVIDKAIEYIEQFYDKNEEVIDAFNFEYSYKHILEILKGDSNE